MLLLVSQLSWLCLVASAAVVGRDFADHHGDDLMMTASRSRVTFVEPPPSFRKHELLVSDGEQQEQGADEQAQSQQLQQIPQRQQQLLKPLSTSSSGHPLDYVRQFVRRHGADLHPGPVDDALRGLTSVYERLPKALKVVVAPNFGSLVRALHSVRGELNVIEAEREAGMDGDPFRWRAVVTTTPETSTITTTSSTITTTTTTTTTATSTTTRRKKDRIVFEKGSKKKKKEEAVRVGGNSNSLDIGGAVPSLPTAATLVASASSSSSRDNIIAESRDRLRKMIAGPQVLKVRKAERRVEQIMSGSSDDVLFVPSRQISLHASEEDAGEEAIHYSNVPISDEEFVRHKLGDVVVGKAGRDEVLGPSDPERPPKVMLGRPHETYEVVVSNSITTSGGGGKGGGGRRKRIRGEGRRTRRPPQRPQMPKHIADRIRKHLQQQRRRQGGGRRRRPYREEEDMMVGQPSEVVELSVVPPPPEFEEDEEEEDNEIDGHPKMLEADQEGSLEGWLGMSSPRGRAQVLRVPLPLHRSQEQLQDYLPRRQQQQQQHQVRLEIAEQTKEHRPISGDEEEEEERVTIVHSIPAAVTQDDDDAKPVTAKSTTIVDAPLLQGNEDEQEPPVYDGSENQVITAPGDEDEDNEMSKTVYQDDPRPPPRPAVLVPVVQQQQQPPPAPRRPSAIPPPPTPPRKPSAPPGLFKQPPRPFPHPGFRKRPRLLINPSMPTPAIGRSGEGYDEDEADLDAESSSVVVVSKRRRRIPPPPRPPIRPSTPAGLKRRRQDFDVAGGPRRLAPTKVEEEAEEESSSWRTRINEGFRAIVNKVAPVASGLALMSAIFAL